MPAPQTNDRPDRIPEPQPENARQAVAMPAPRPVDLGRQHPPTPPAPPPL